MGSLTRGQGCNPRVGVSANVMTEEFGIKPLVCCTCVFLNVLLLQLTQQFCHLVWHVSVFNLAIGAFKIFHYWIHDI